MMAWKHFQLLSAIVLLQIYLIAPMSASCPDDETTSLAEENLTGLNVVERVISKLLSLQLFKCDHYRLLKRIALVETEYGLPADGHGGIWALSKSQFEVVTKEVHIVLSKLCLNTSSVTPYKFLNRPLVSGLAASFYLNYLENNRSVEIPLARHIEEQAVFWKVYYHSRNLTAHYFVDQVKSKDCDCSCYRGEPWDLTLQDGANGSDVVEMVLAKISGMPDFSSDHHLLRRIAYVETDDGTSGVPPGGIWAVDEWKLSIVLTAPELVELRVKIFQELYTQFECDPLSKPLVSGLAARLYLHYLEIVKNAIIPLAADIEKQAEFWHTHYYNGTDGLTVDNFTMKVNELKSIQRGWLLNADIFFVLDVSASIKEDNFKKVRTFERNFVQKLAIGPNDNQVGTIIFDDEADLFFKLNSHSNQRSLLHAVNNIPYYLPYFTNIKDALCKLVEGFSECNGARSQSLGVFRIAILLTDGRSNVHNSSCGWDTIEEAAAAVHALNILVYVIAVGDEVNWDEIYAIASPIPGAVANLTDFDPKLLEGVNENNLDGLRTKVSQGISTDEKMNVTLSGNKTIRYNLLLPVIGVTVEVCITEGHLHAYGSLSVPNPNSAFHDFVIELDYENDNNTCGHAYVEPCAAPTFSPRLRRQTSQSNIDNQVVYLSIVGMAEKNSFIVNGTAGDLYHTETITPGPPDNKTGLEKSNERLIIVATSSSGSLLLLLSCLLIIGIVGGTVYHYKKKKKQKTLKEDEYHLLPQDDDTIEF